MEVPSGERLRSKSRHGVPCRLNCVIHNFYTMQRAIQVFCFIVYLLTRVHIVLLATAENHHSVVGTHCTFPQRDGQAELTWLTKINFMQLELNPDVVTHPVLTWPGVEQLHWCDWFCHYTKPPPLQKLHFLRNEWTFWRKNCMNYI